MAEEYTTKFKQWAQKATIKEDSEQCTTSQRQ